MTLWALGRQRVGVFQDGCCPPPFPPHEVPACWEACALSPGHSLGPASTSLWTLLDPNCSLLPAVHSLPPATSSLGAPQPSEGRVGPTGVTVTLGASQRCPAESSMPSPSTGACAESLPEAGERGGDVPPQAGQPQEAGSQADTARAARGPAAGGAHQVALPLPRYEQPPLTPGNAPFYPTHCVNKVLLALGPLTRSL